MSNIKRIVIEVGGVELSLSPEDAKTLKQALDELFPAKSHIQYVPAPYPVYTPRPWHWHEYVPGVRLLSTTASMSDGDNGVTTTLNLGGSSIRHLSQ